MSERDNPLMDLLDLYVWRDGAFRAPANHMSTLQRVALLRVAHALDAVLKLPANWNFRAKNNREDRDAFRDDLIRARTLEDCARELADLFAKEGA